MMAGVNQLNSFKNLSATAGSILAIFSDKASKRL
jgi:hypothetical protein